MSREPPLNEVLPHFGLAQVADLCEFAQATAAGEGTLHLEKGYSFAGNPEDRSLPPLEQVAFSPPSLRVVAPNQLDPPEDS